MNFELLIQSIKNDEENQSYTSLGWEPIVLASKEAKIVIVGQAPGLETQIKQRVFDDRSGDYLRSWMNVTVDQFYNSNQFAVLPLDFYFPGKASSGDKPPRKHIASKWHPQFLSLMPNVQLIILAGAYAQKEYLGSNRKNGVTETVRHYNDYLPTYFPIIHPSPLNQRWTAKNPFFIETVVPALKHVVHTILNTNP